MELTTLLWCRCANDDHQNEGCGIDHGDLFTRSATRRTALAVPAPRSTAAPGSGGRGPGINGGPYDPRPPRRERAESQFARGIPNHPDGDFDVFTGR
jgi:hypothetical protein